MSIENYNIYNLLTFSIKNNIGGLSGINFNPEYKYFRSNKIHKNHFTIDFKHLAKGNSSLLIHNNHKWQVNLESLFSENNFYLGKHKLDFIEKYTYYVRNKNLYVRSLISIFLLKSDASLIHSSGFCINNKSYILAGRPGVFKTSILMDAIRYHHASYIGEENCLIKNNLAYPFPLNVDSIYYKLNHFKDENPTNIFQKLLLGLNILWNNNKEVKLKVAEPSIISNLCYLYRGNEFKIEKVMLSDVLSDLIENELLELSIPPTHTMSGINYNYFCEIMNNVQPNFSNDFRCNLKTIFTENFKQCNVFRITNPKKYDKDITVKIIDKLLAE